jgi:hypothetical protein
VRVTFGSSCLINLAVAVAPIPREQFVESLNRMLGDARQDVGEPRLRINVVHLGCLCRRPNYAERS